MRPVELKHKSDARNTPRADMEAWIKDLAGDDDKLVGSARRRLVARGPLAVEPLLAALGHPLNVNQYRGALRVLGDIATDGGLSPIAPTRALLLEHLKNHDNAERRSIVACLGRLGVDAEAESALLNLWAQEKRDDQLRVLAAAIGRVGGARSEMALETCVSSAPLVLREIATARAALSTRKVRAVAGEGRVIGEKIVSGIAVRLRCRSGLSGLLLRHLPASVRQARETAPGQIDAELRGSLDSLLDCRLWSEAVFRVEMPPKAGAPESFGRRSRQGFRVAAGPDRRRAHLAIAIAQRFPRPASRFCPRGPARFARIAKQPKPRRLGISSSRKCPRNSSAILARHPF
jgi:hypothetical protein